MIEVALLTIFIEDGTQNLKQRSKRKTNYGVTCYHSGRKGQTKPDCWYFKKELEHWKNADDKKKNAKETKTIDTKGSNVIIANKILCTTLLISNSMVDH